jgi:hypothetical protein
LKISTTLGVEEEVDRNRIRDGYLTDKLGFRCPLDFFLAFLRSDVCSRAVAEAKTSQNLFFSKLARTQPNEDEDDCDDEDVNNKRRKVSSKEAASSDSEDDTGKHRKGGRKSHQ